ncbi:MAG: Ig domain protein group 2 domain protein [Candidatus Eremiobacteraeota bacterium]|jgi:hypothetical protein|nr:Ig domain protein group 2 domain protein [Candidatus Eremiobacteraeota bacterium]
MMDRLSPAIVAAFVAALLTFAAAAAQQGTVTLSVSQQNSSPARARVATDPTGIRGFCLEPCSAQFTSGTTVTISVDRSGGSWGGACAGQTGTSCKLRMDADRSVSIVFAAATLTLNQSHDLSGIVEVNPDPRRSFYSSCRPGGCRQAYDVGTVVTLRPNLPPGTYPRVVFGHWEGDCAGQSATCTLTMDRDKHVDIVWDSGEPKSSGAFVLRIVDTYPGAFEVTPPGATMLDCRPGVSVCEQHFNAGTKVTIRAFLGGDVVFDHWEGACAGQESTCAITISGDTVIKAFFTKR